MPKNLIQISTNSWIVMRESPYEPRAIIHKVTDSQQMPKLLLMRWAPSEEHRVLVGVYETMKAAEQAVPWDTHVAPGHPGMSHEEWAANMRARGVDGSGRYGAKPGR
ncbi:MAG: hypothetical protein D3X82_13750 [Candidatus Leucobacter sulfamidivorax]|nr:hypothetical protein [Candidatus Leucobacter sulfamidivorax]